MGLSIIQDLLMETQIDEIIRYKYYYCTLSYKVYPPPTSERVESFYINFIIDRKFIS